jgi:gentisate 1,2-dioxygenase
MSPTPRPVAVPWLWPGATLRRLCAQALEVVPIEAGGDRRAFPLANPGLGGVPLATPTLSCAYQTLGPRETVPVHRHTPAALRFILEGNGVWTSINGDLCEMNEGDLLLTPSWTTHDHRNHTDATMTWFDGLDLPLVRALDAMFHEHAAEPAADREHWSASRYVAPGLVPDDGADPAGEPWSRLLVYRWQDTDRALASLLAASDNGAATLRFVDPASGRSALPTIACRMLRLATGAATKPRRHTGNEVLLVYRGSGFSVIDGVRFDWAPGDVIALPSWAMVEHHAADHADIFAMGDDPVLRAVHLYREETPATPQVQTGTFTGAVDGER